MAGRNLFNRLTGRTSSSPSKSEADDENARYTRRREQVRRAQRTHRDRRATYVKNLEVEVAYLRQTTGMQKDKISHYRTIIQHLQTLLAQNGVPIPVNTELSPEKLPSPEAFIEVFETAVPIQNVRAKMPASPRPTQPEQVGIDLYDPQVGVDFVLALEHPCLYHHQPGEEGTGHVMMMQAPIMARGPAYKTSGQQGEKEIPQSATWTVPAAELENLLNMSNTLDIGVDEITPIQAWQRIQQDGGCSKLTVSQWNNLKVALVAEVQCYGFGAVMELTKFTSILQQFSRT